MDYCVCVCVCGGRNKYGSAGFAHRIARSFFLPQNLSARSTPPMATSTPMIMPTIAPAPKPSPESASSVTSVPVLLGSVGNGLGGFFVGVGGAVVTFQFTGMDWIRVLRSASIHACPVSAGFFFSSSNRATSRASRSLPAAVKKMKVTFAYIRSAAVSCFVTNTAAAVTTSFSFDAAPATAALNAVSLKGIVGGRGIGQPPTGHDGVRVSVSVPRLAVADVVPDVVAVPNVAVAVPGETVAVALPVSVPAVADCVNEADLVFRTRGGSGVLRRNRNRVVLLCDRLCDVVADVVPVCVAVALSEADGADNVAVAVCDALSVAVFVRLGLRVGAGVGGAGVAMTTRSTLTVTGFESARALAANATAAAIRRRKAWRVGRRGANAAGPTAAAAARRDPTQDMGKVRVCSPASKTEKIKIEDAPSLSTSNDARVSFC